MASIGRTTTSPLEAAVVAAICFGHFAVKSVQAMFAGFPVEALSDSGFLELVLWEVLTAAAALAWLRYRGFGVATLLPAPSVDGCLLGVLLYFAANVASYVSQLAFATDLQPQPIMRMLTLSHLSLPVVALVAVVNGIFEEVFLLGYLTRGLRAYGLAVALGVPALVRLLCHVYQGPLGAVSVMAVGLVFGVYYLRTNRLWPAVFAHMLLDFMALVLMGG